MFDVMARISKFSVGEKTSPYTREIKSDFSSTIKEWFYTVFLFLVISDLKLWMF